MSVDGSAVRKPEWLRKPPGLVNQAAGLKRLLRAHSLNTVCEEARCPNISECFGRGTATFMILGDVCTRGCRFCSVQTGRPHFSPVEFEREGERVAEASEAMGLRHVVVTSVARDDLEDGGASGFAYTIAALRRRLPAATVEVLIPDFRGSSEALRVVTAALPDVLNHNLETVPRLYRRVRPGSVYRRSLELLRNAKDAAPSIKTKTGVMVGLGENPDEVESVMADAKEYGVDIFTIGQYLQPTREHLPVHEFVSLEQFADYERRAEKVGLPQAFIGPLVRSSYHADELIHSAEESHAQAG